MMATMNPDQFLEHLDSITPTEDGTHIDALDELTDAAEDIATEPATMAAIFAYFERYSNADLGSPGPLVHFIEKAFPHYVEELLSSLNRRPVAYSLWMANRILNAQIEESLRTRLLQALTCASKHPLASEDEKEQAFEFVQLHTQVEG